MFLFFLRYYTLFCLVSCISFSVLVKYHSGNDGTANDTRIFGLNYVKKLVSGTR